MKVLKYLVIALVMATSFTYAETASAKAETSIFQPGRRVVVVRRGPRRTVVTRRVYRRSYRRPVYRRYHRPVYRHYRHY